METAERKAEPDSNLQSSVFRRRAIPRSAEFFLGLAVIVAATVALAQSWNAWLDPVIDGGRDLYVAERIANGAKLYDDVLYYYPPLVPYLLAAAGTLIGHSLAAWTAIGIAQSLGIAWLLWICGRELGGRWGGFAASLLFVSFNMTGASTFGANFVFPYSHPATVGMLLLLAFVAASLRGREGLATVLAVAASFTKLEYAAVATVGMIVFAHAGKLAWRAVVKYLAASAATAAAVTAYFGLDAVRANVFAESLLRGRAARSFYARVMGRTAWETALAEALAGIAILALIAFLIDRNRRRLAMAAMIAGGVLLPVTAFFRAAGVGQWGTLAQRRRDALLFAVGAVSIVATLRIALNVAPVWYGFVLVVPLYLVIARFIRGEVIWAALIVVLSLRSLADQRDRYALKRYPISTPRGVVLDHNPDRAAVLGQVIPRLRNRSVAVFPEGLAINYFASSPSTISYHTFTPAETADPAVEGQIIEELRSRPPDCVIILTRDVSEFGSKGFGVDYDQRLLATIRELYVVEQAWALPRFSLVLMKRAAGTTADRGAGPQPAARSPQAREVLLSALSTQHSALSTPGH